jgi:hypothetical protein
MYPSQPVRIPDVSHLNENELVTLQVIVNEVLKTKQEDQSAQARLAELLQSRKGQGLLERWIAAKAAALKYNKTQTIKIKVLLQVELEASVCLNDYNFENCEFDDADLFDVDLDGTVMKTKGLTPDQIRTFNYGLSQVLDAACDEKMDLLPTLKHELSGIAAELQDIKELLGEHDLSVTDIEKLATPKKKKKK